MIPGKKYKPEDILEIAWRRRWVLVVPLVLFAIGAFIYSRTLPNRYRSEAVVLIIPPQVPENYVRSTITDSLKERLELIRQQILSRTRLERIIKEFDLYPEERKTMLIEQVVERMRDDITVTPAKAGRRQDPGHFTVSYDSENPQTAMVVAERLASLFVRENVEGRNTQTEGTTQFLQSQVDEALRKLQDHEARLEAFRRTNAGRLPGEVDTNLQMMQSARQEIQAITDSINRDRDQQITIERTIADEVAIAAATRGRTAGTGTGGQQTRQTVAQQLTDARTALAALQLRLKADHPDLRTAKKQVAELEEKAAAEALQQPVADGVTAVGLDPGDAERQRRLAQLRTQFESLERGIAPKKARLDRAQATLVDFQNRVQSAPGLESELSELMRDAGIYKTTYENLLRKMQDAKLASNLEQRQVGEQFRILDPARRPERPRSPDRVRMNLIGALLGLGLGVAIAGLLEYRDTSLRTEEDVLVALSLPVVALVPTLHTDAEIEKGRRRRRLILASSVGVTLLVSAAAIVWKLRLLESWGL